jgi:hypothetical protein
MAIDTSRLRALRRYLALISGTIIDTKILVRERLTISAMKKDRYSITPWIIGLIIAGAILAPTVHSWYNTIDDHQIVSWLGATHALSPNRIWNKLTDMKFGTFGDKARFHPLFFCYWLIETALLGDSPSLYHVLRAVYFGLFLGAMIWLSAPMLGIAIATLAAALFALQPFWGGVWAYSLGVTEQLAAVGLAITAVGYRYAISTWLSKQPRDCRAVLTVSVGTAIAIGCKENFLFLLLPLAVTIVAFYRLRTLKSVYFAISLPFIAFSVFCLVKVVSIFIGAQVDYYGVDSSLSHRIQVLFAARGFLAFAFVSEVGAIIVAFIALRNSKLERQRLAAATEVFLVCLTLLCAYLIWEMFFYNGRLPSGGRYDFPFRLLPMLIIGAFAAFLIVVFPSNVRWWRLAAVLCLALTATWNPINFNFRAVYDQALAESLRTERFRTDLDDLASKARLNPSWPIVIEVDNGWDYEPIITFHSWSAYKAIINPIVLHVTIPAETTVSPFQAELVHLMKVWAVQGLPGHFAPVENFSRLLAEGHCFLASAAPIDPTLLQCHQQHLALLGVHPV